MIRPLMVAVLMLLVTSGGAHGQQLRACSRGDIAVCRTILQRSRLDPGRRAAIEFLLKEIERLVLACTGGDEAACVVISRDHPELLESLRKPHRGIDR